MEQKTSVGATYNLFVQLHGFVCRVDDAEILVNLYDAKEMKYIWYVVNRFVRCMWIENIVEILILDCDLVQCDM